MTERHVIAVAGLILSCFAGPTVLAQSLPSALHETVLSGQDLQDLGVARLHDVFWLIDGARLSTVDDFGYSASLDGTGSPGASRWNVFVDGMPQDIGAWEARNLDVLTVPLRNIDSVRVRPYPTFSHGLTNAYGSIEIWTRLPEAGLSSSLGLMAINETGDPGPYRYTRDDLRVANVDKSGPDGTLLLATANDRADLRFVGSWLQHIPSDAAAFTRNRAAFDVATTPEMVLRSAGLSARLHGHAVQHAARASLHSFDDMMYLAQLSREVPTKSLRGSVGYRLSRNRDQGLRSVTATLEIKSIKNDSRATRRPIDWQERRLLVSSEFRFLRSLSVGVSGRYVRVESPQGMENGISETLVAVQLANRPASGPRVNLALTTDGSRIGLFAAASGEFGVSANQHASLRVTATRLIGESVHSSLYWSTKGHSLDETVDLDVNAFVGASWRFSADAGWSVRSERHRAEVGVGSRVLLDEPLLRREIRYLRPAFAVVDGTAESVAGLLQTAWLSAGWTRGSFSQDGHYSLMLPAGDAAFTRSHRSSARHVVRVSSVLGVSPSFSISSVIWFQSATKWPEYATSTLAAGNSYSHRLASFVRADATVIKGFWNNHADVSISLRNVAGDNIVLHPIGARLDRALVVRLRVALP